ncbi:MAG: CCA tRNA nucleotidyltransferase, partial [Senegalia sp. (in: firmicutes)]
SELAKIILKRLNSPKKLINTVSTLVKEHMIGHNEFSDKGLKRVINRVGRKEIYMLLDLMRADKICTNENVNTNDIDKLEIRIREILNRKDPMSIKDLAIDGKDLIDLGIPQGKEIGRILKELFEMVMEDEKLNNKEKLLEIMKKRHKKS